MSILSVGYLYAPIVPTILSCIIVTLVGSLIQMCIKNPRPTVHILNPMESFEFSRQRVLKIYYQTAHESLQTWFRQHPDRAVALHAESGPLTILPASMADEIRRDKRLNLNKIFDVDFHSHLPGFEPFQTGKHNDVVHKVIPNHLTKQLAKITAPLIEETAIALDEIFTQNPNWHELPLRDAILRLVTRISSRVFLGEELCRNEEWLHVAQEFTLISSEASAALKQWPPFSRRFANTFLEPCRKLRTMTSNARVILDPILKQRKQERQDGQDTTRYNDLFEWFEASRDGKECDPVLGILVIVFAAIETTTDLLMTTLFYIASNSSIIQPLPDEIMQVYQSDGWQKTALIKMKLLDSVVKESQRLKPVTSISMQRIATETIKLTDGTVIPKHSRIAVSASRSWDPEFYQDADSWDGYRFLNMANNPKLQSTSHLVSPSPEHLGFGYGQHACPGRFFAANEIKVALLTILTRYDIALPKGSGDITCARGMVLGANPMASMDVRRRNSEI